MKRLLIIIPVLLTAVLIIMIIRYEYGRVNEAVMTSGQPETGPAEVIEVPVETIKVIDDVPYEEMDMDDLLIIRLNQKGYSEVQISTLMDRLAVFELTPLLVYDYLDDIEAYIDDCISNRDSNSSDSFVLAGDYAGYSEDPKVSPDYDGIEVLVNKKYRLPSDYVPDTVALPEDYAREGMELVPEAAEMFMKMSDAAAEEGLRIYGTSAYRSYDRQDYLYNNYVSKWGQEEADAVSARPGHSEHQTGLAIDLTVDGGLSSFTGTPEHKWMLEHASEYGFILRYPENKTAITGYSPESWHYRYLGTELAKKLKESGLTYDEYYNLYLKS